jgi:hypothetical protein
MLAFDRKKDLNEKREEALMYVDQGWCPRGGEKTFKIYKASREVYMKPCHDDISSGI